MFERHYVVYRGNEDNPISLSRRKRKDIIDDVRTLSSWGGEPYGFKMIRRKDVEKVRDEVRGMAWAKLLGSVDDDGKPFYSGVIN